MQPGLGLKYETGVSHKTGMNGLRWGKGVAGKIPVTPVTGSGCLDHLTALQDLAPHADDHFLHGDIDAGTLHALLDDHG